MRLSTVAPQTGHKWLLPGLLILTLALAGCSEDDPATPQTGDPEPAVAAGLAATMKTPAILGSTMNDLNMFANPLTSLAADAGLSQETPVDDTWTGEGVDYSFPAKMSQAASGFRSVGGMVVAGVSTTMGSVRELAEQALNLPLPKAEGDTIAVTYHDTADSTGLDALIETAIPDLVRLVSRREYPNAVWLQVSARDTEVLLDTNGTLENGEDDAYHSVDHQVTLAMGEVATGTLIPVSGSGPMEPGVQVRATHHVQNPRFHPLQQWYEAVIVLDPGEFQLEGDEIFQSLSTTVHWRNGAEHSAAISPVSGGSIGGDTDVLAVGNLTAAPGDNWLESTSDTLLVQLGDLESEEDDLLFSLSRAAIFDGTASDGGHPRSLLRLVPVEPVGPGEEPCGGTAYQDIHYPATWWLVHLTRSADISCDGSGTLQVIMEMRNGSTFSRLVTWDGADFATVTENRADGTTVAGSFNENTGAYSVVTTFPDGHDPISRDRHGTMLEGVVEGYEIFTWQDAHVDSTYFSATETDGETSIVGYRIDGDVREDFTLTESSDGSSSGTYSRNDGARGQFDLQVLDGGGRHLTFSAANPSEEGDPSLTGEVWFAPDGSGTGTVTFTQNGNSITYVVNFGSDGVGTLSDGQGGEILF